MATLEDRNNIEDFSDLGQSFNFKYLGNDYTIPPIPPSKAKKLIKISTELSKKPESNEELNPEDVSNSAEDMFNAQIKFIAEAGVRKIEGETFVPVMSDEIENEWSTQLVMKIFEKINGIIFGSVNLLQEKKS